MLSGESTATEELLVVALKVLFVSKPHQVEKVTLLHLWGLRT